MKLHFVEFNKCTNRYQWDNGIGSFICLYITWKKWNFIHKFPPMEILINIWWKSLSLHRNSRYIAKIIKVRSLHASQKLSLRWKKNVLIYQNIGFRLLPNEKKKIWNLIIFELTKVIEHFKSLWSNQKKMCKNAGVGSA